MSKYTIKQFRKDFPNDEACLASIMELKFGGTHILCPACGVVDAQFHPLKNRRAYCCQECGHAIYPCANTIFHKSRTKLTDWFLAMHMLTNSKHGTSAKELQRLTGVTYKCAWRMLHELRKLMASADYSGPLSGHVEVDETQFGGRQKRHDAAWKGSNKTIIMGMTERDGGKMRSGVVTDIYGATLQDAVLQNVTKGSKVSTDELRSYRGLGMHYEHRAVNHSEKEWTHGEHHTNTIESHWGHFKRSVKGTHTSVSKRHLWKYVAEFNYRKNFRYSQQFMFDRLFSAVALPRPEAG